MRAKFMLLCVVCVCVSEVRENMSEAAHWCLEERRMSVDFYFSYKGNSTLFFSK